MDAHPGHGDFYPEEIESSSNNVKDTTPDLNPVKTSNSKYSSEKSNYIKSSEKSDSNMKTDSNENGNINKNTINNSMDSNNNTDNVNDNISKIESNSTNTNFNLQTCLILILTFFIGFGVIIGISKIKK